MSAVIETTKTDDLITISISGSELSTDQIQRLLDLVKAESIVSRSKLTQKDADEISRDINRSWWKQNRSRIEKMISGNE
ncbi:MAG: hypothetical protein ACRD6X_03215 [Pyrinomonadaceae bacterium]